MLLGGGASSLLLRREFEEEVSGRGVGLVARCANRSGDLFTFARHGLR